MTLGGPGHDNHQHHVIYWDCQEGGAAKETWQVPVPEADGTWTEGTRVSAKDVRKAPGRSTAGRVRTVLFVAFLFVLFVLWRRRVGANDDETS